MNGVGVEHIVTRLGAVAGNVTECPDGLFGDGRHLGFKQFDELGNGVRLNDGLRLVGGAGRHVGQRPGGLEL